MAPPNERTVKGKAYGNANAYLFAYHQTSTQQYTQMLQMVVAQQQLELGRAEVLRKQLADLDDRIVAYEKLAASFETPKGGGGGSGTTKNFMLEAEMEIATLRAKEDSTKAGIVEEVGRDTYANQASISQFLSKSSDRSIIINAGGGNTDNLVAELDDAYYTNILDAEGSKNSIAKQDAAAKLLQQVSTELTRAGVTGTEKDKVIHKIGIMSGVLNAGDVVSGATSTKVRTALGPSGMSSARSAEIDTRLSGSGIGFLDEDSGVAKPDKSGNFTNAELIRFRGETGARTFGGSRAKQVITQSKKDQALDNVLVGLLRDDGEAEPSDTEREFASKQVTDIIKGDKAYADLIVDGEVDFDKLFRSRVGASTRVQQAAELGALQTERTSIRRQLGGAVGKPMTPEQMLGRAGQLRDDPIPAGAPKEERVPDPADAMRQAMTPQQRMQMDYMSEATGLYKNGKRAITDRGSSDSMLYASAKEKLEKGEITKAELFEYLTGEANSVYNDIDKARTGTKKALQQIYLDDIRAFDVSSNPVGE